ncbi:hypothetical protein P879_08731 [Paragonimus westermani]|uniref:Uncharacterized protein n=1 Tax=Paragonimus westermani TaxID=34504 RepID=A0A8T0DBN5_9TREM|nr:hypothetical protein P879_08731 [Paragonimus westermani]
MLQLFLVHIRLELESELLSKPSKLSADASVEEPTEPLGGALTNQGEYSTHDHVSPEQQNTHAMRKKEEEAEEASYQFFEDLDNDFVFEPSILLDFESSGSSDSGEADLIHSFHLNGIGLLVQGKESLVELSECYVLHLNTRLYDLCLRRLRGLGPKFLNPLMTQLPNYILHDLKSVYCESVMVNNSDSG